MDTNCGLKMRSRFSKLLILFSVAFFILLVTKSEREETPEAPVDPLLVVHQGDTSFFHSSKKPRDKFKEVESEVDGIRGPRTCHVEEWNKVHTDHIPQQEIHDEWLEKRVQSRGNYLYHKTPSPLAAYVYEKHVTVTLTAENKYNKTVFCRYFDCNRKEISQPFQSVVFPESTVHCGRRIGAEYMSVTETNDEIPEIPVPIRNRSSKIPRHFFTVCMATLYGDEPKFLQIVDFIEYHKLQGATFFHIYLRNTSAYDRMLLDDYVRTGEIELIVFNDHYWRADFMWHNGQINDCHWKSVNFAKWTAFIDIDERIEVKGRNKQVVDYLETVKDPNINNLQFHIQWVLKDSDTPERYENDQQLIENMIFRKYHNTSRVGPSYKQPKCIIRPERVGAMGIHGPNAVYKGYIQTLVNTTTGVIRHYRNVGGGALYLNNHLALEMGPYSNTSIDEDLEKKLTENILSRVKNVYDTEKKTCAEQMKMYRIHGGLKANCSLHRH